MVPTGLDGSVVVTTGLEVVLGEHWVSVVEVQADLGYVPANQQAIRVNKVLKMKNQGVPDGQIVQRVGEELL